MEQMIDDFNTISANTLFHFTGDHEIITNILNDGYFLPRYCIETFKDVFEGLSESPGIEYAIPMVCFCDIPLAKIREHVKDYGGYALGLNKEWGIKKGLNPVFYLTREAYQNSILQKTFLNLQRYINSINTDFSHREGILNSRDCFFELTYFLKPYIGKPWNNQEKEFCDPKKKFYDEREWRYIPNLDEMDMKALANRITKDEYSNNGIREKYNNLLNKKGFTLEFKTEDIKYIIVEDESQVLYMAEKIKNSEKYSENEKYSLIAKLMSLERVKQDI